MENSSKLSKKERLKIKFINLISSSTSHGLPNIFRTKRKFLKIMWLTFFIIFTLIGIFMVYSTIDNYLKYEVVTRVEIIHEIPVEFPAVTIMNLNDPQSNQSLKDIMPLCMFNGEPCTEDDFETIHDKYEFVYFKLKKKITYSTGVSQGLFLLIFSNGTKGFGGNGLQVVIHNNTINPETHMGASQQGEYVSIGFHTNININRVIVEKLGHPYSTCIKNTNDVDSFHSDLYKYIIMNTNYTYRQKDCFDYCMGREIHKKINKNNDKIEHFHDAGYYYIELVKKGLFKIEPDLKDFSLKLLKGNAKKICSTECPLECDSIRYELSISNSKILIENFQSNFKRYELPINQFFERLTSKDTKNIASLSINYKQLEYTSIKEVPKMDFYDLISNIGGNLGLFIGISFLSFAEIIEFIVEAFYILCERRAFHGLPTTEPI